MVEETGATYTCEALKTAGIELIVGLPGTQTLPIDRVIAEQGSFDYVMARHETAIPHIAWGYYEVAGRPAATLTVPGPGETNAMHGLNNAKEDCVPIVHLTGDADPDHRGKKPIHEIDPRTYDPVVKENAIVESADEIPTKIPAAIECALTPPTGPVRLGIPTPAYDEPIDAPPPRIAPKSETSASSLAYAEAIEVLEAATRPVVIVGGGISRSPAGMSAARSLVRTLDAPVLSSYKGKGVIPETADRWMGTMGGSMPPGAIAVLERADVVLAIGTDLDGLATRNWSLSLGEDLIHITLDPSAIGASYHPTVGLVADAGEAMRALEQGLTTGDHQPRWDGASIGRRVQGEYITRLEEEGLLTEGPPLHIPAMLRTVRETIPDEAIVITDVGGFRVWALQTFPVNDRSRYVTAGSWAGMGVGLPAAIGAKLAEPDTPVICLTGDGGLLMCLQELATAVEESLSIVTVVANNSDYGIISKRYGDDHPRWDPPFGWQSPSFPTIARGFGWHTASVGEAPALSDSLEQALARAEPTLIDVTIASDEPAPGQMAEFDTTVSFD